MDKSYIEIVRLMLESAPAIFEEPFFAMKGGTAINLFIEDMPRLSVDIDVVYTDHRGRPVARRAEIHFLGRFGIREPTASSNSDWRPKVSATAIR